MVNDNGTTATAETPSDALPLPQFVVIGTEPRFTPNELRVLKAMTGRTLESIMGDEADAMQAMAWMRLRRQGHSVTWDQAGDVEVVMTDDAVDPTSSEPAMPSQDSAATGA